jgi:hypothetical protein
MTTEDWAHLVFQVIPPIRPRLFYTTLFFEDRLSDHGSEHAKCHRDAVIIIAVDANALFEFDGGFAVYLEAIIQFLCFDTELRCIRRKLEHQLDSSQQVNHT